MNDSELYICRFIGQPPRAMYDIGVGRKTEWKTLTDKYPGMLLFGAEPLKETFDLLADTFPGILFRAAIHKDRSAYLHVPDNPQCASLLPLPDTARIRTSCMTLDEFDRACGRPKHILLWIDVEGSEFDVLSSGRKLLASGRVEWINVEEWLPGCEPHEKWSNGVAVNVLLHEYGYKRAAVYAEHSTHHDVIYVKSLAQR